jgi:tape measure domain-containing protein
VSQNLQFNLNVDTGTAVSEINNFFQTFDQGAAQASNKLRKAFNEPLKTEVEISLKNGEIVAKKIESMNTNSGKVKAAYKALNGEIGKTPAKLNKQLSILKEIQGNTEKYKSGTKKLSAEWKKVEERIRKVKQEQDKLTGSEGGGQMDNFIGKFALVQTAANLATAGIMAMGRAVQDMAAQGVRLEMLMLQLEAFTGGAAQAEAAYEAFGQTARQTPFNVEQVANAGKIMMAFGVDTNTAVDMTDRLAIAAAATGGDINNLGRNLGQIAAQGQAYTRDLHQFAMQGLPIWDEMSDVTGKSVVELKKLASEGKISFEIVSAAIKNMTADGTAFEQVAKRMQETFAGRLASIETSAANLSLALIDAFNEIDEATGGVITGAMADFATTLQDLADGMPAFAEAVAQTFNEIGGMFNFVKGIWDSLTGIFGKFLNILIESNLPLKTIKASFDSMGKAAQQAWDAIQPMQLALAAMAGPAIVVGIGSVIKAIYGMMTATYAYIKAQIISLGLSGPTGWAILAGAAVATAGAYLMLKGNLDEANASMDQSVKEQEEAKQAMADANKQVEDNTDGQGKMKVAIDDTTEALKDQADAAALAAKNAKFKYDEESDALKASITARIDAEKQGISELSRLNKDAAKAEKDRYKEAKEAVKDRYDTEISRAKQAYDAKLSALNMEIDRLGEMGPKEKELYDLNKKELEQKIKSGDLSAKEKLELEAQLERMNRQEQIQRLQNEAKQVELQKSQKIAQLEEERDSKLKEMKAEHEAIIDALDAEKNTLDEQKRLLDEKKSGIDQVASGVEAYNGNLDEGISKLNTMLGTTQSLKSEWEDLAAIASQAKLDASAAKANGSSGSSGSDVDGTRASGGPVTGGGTYQVNELGKEAFLSAAGKLSMINAPAYGKWRAPGAGTVIPAHLTKQLNIPTGGVNLNGSAGANASRAGAGGMSGMVRAISNAMGGDTISNNVTIQAINPTSLLIDLCKRPEQLVVPLRDNFQGLLA